MEKIYGYKKCDIEGLIECLKQNQNAPLSKVFEIYAEKTGKSKGTVRNLYYALAKASSQDQEFCDIYLGGNALSVQKIAPFSSDEEQKLIKNILLEREQGKSVRSIILKMADGDARLALRYQNKFRNAVKNKPETVRCAVDELKGQGNNISEFKFCKPNALVSDGQINALKKEIDALFERVSLKLKQENQSLKERVLTLENENMRLLSFIKCGTSSDTLEYFSNGGEEKDMLN